MVSVSLGRIEKTLMFAKMGKLFPVKSDNGWRILLTLECMS